MTRNRTELAFIARGIDSESARDLRVKGWTLAKLQLADPSELKDLMLSPETIEVLSSEARPPVPIDDLMKVLFANRWLCCVCRDPSRPIVVHHINPWSQSRDHSPDNLAVICSIHHGEAHTTHALEMSLNMERLHAQKERWEQEVKRLDRFAIQQATQVHGCNWWFFNHLRLFELASEVGVEFTSLAGFQRSFASGRCDEDGAILGDTASGSLHGGPGGLIFTQYVANVLEATLEHATVRNLSDELDRGTLSSLVMPGDFIFVQGRYQFTDLTPASPGSQPVTGTRSVNSVEIKFVFNRNEGTSTSARELWLTGTQSLGCLIKVVCLERSGSKIHLAGTVLGIRNALPELKTRTYEYRLHDYGLGLDYMVDEGAEDLSAFDDLCS